MARKDRVPELEAPVCAVKASRMAPPCAPKSDERIPPPRSTSVRRDSSLPITCPAPCSVEPMRASPAATSGTALDATFFVSSDPSPAALPIFDSTSAGTYLPIISTRFIARPSCRLSSERLPLRKNSLDGARSMMVTAWR